MTAPITRDLQAGRLDAARTALAAAIEGRTLPEAARYLGISRSTLCRAMKQCGVRRMRTARKQRSLPEPEVIQVSRYSQTQHLSTALEPRELRQAVAWCLKEIRGLPQRPQTIVCQGISGHAVAFPVSVITGCKIVTFRKGEMSGSDGASERYGDNMLGDDVVGRYVVIDDFVDTGSSVRTMVARAGKAVDPKLVAILLYGAYNEPDENLRKLQLERVTADKPLVLSGAEARGSLKLERELEHWLDLD